MLPHSKLAWRAFGAVEFAEEEVDSAGLAADEDELVFIVIAEGEFLLAAPGEQVFFAVEFQVELSVADEDVPGRRSVGVDTDVFGHFCGRQRRDGSRLLRFIFETESDFHRFIHTLPHRLAALVRQHNHGKLPRRHHLNHRTVATTEAAMTDELQRASPVAAARLFQR